jgi:hypothetical protein
MTTDTVMVMAIATLLREVETAHGTYEAHELGGVFDEAWPDWYAGYLLGHGLGDRLPGAVALGVSGLAPILARLAANYEREQPAEPWPEDYARRLVASLGPSADDGPHQ